MTLERQRNSGCLSDLRLDRWMMGELDQSDRRAAGDHLDGCGACQKRLAELERDREHFRAELPPLVGMAERAKQVAKPRPNKARTWRWQWRLAPALVACAAIVIALIVTRDRGRPLGEDMPVDTTRVKGDAHLSWFVQRGGSVSAGDGQVPVLPGDQVRFALSSQEPKYVAIISVDGDQNVSIYHPAGARAERVAAGREVPLPSAIELDGVLGPEVVYGFLCSEPIEVEQLRQRIADRTPSHSSCVVDVIRWNKVAP